MGSPLSCFLAEIYLNNIENEHIFSQKNKHVDKIKFFGRYVDDIVIFYAGNTRQLEVLNKYLNNISKNLKFTLELESNGSINFLDLTLKRIDNRIQFSIFRKPTATSHTIHATSYHPMAAYNSMINRLLSIPPSKTDYENEVLLIKH